ncbi:MAG TPA: hypothetical protein VGQ75_11195 [Thermoanaerobaculia bacterium]|jgi:hypothetical protein|nr:hypothetical protein [Thermoanaerobaculia bacterium]
MGNFKEKAEGVLDWLARGQALVALLAALGVGRGVKAALDTFASIPPIWVTPLWLLASAGALAIFLFLINRARARAKQPVRKSIAVPSHHYVGQTFEDRQVVLDDSVYDECVFINVIFRYDGGEFAFANSRIEGSRRFETNNRYIRGTIDLLKSLGFLSEAFARSWKHLEVR